MRGTSETTLALETAAEREPEMLRFRSPLRHSTETLRMALQACSDKRLGQWVVSSTSHIPLATLIDACLATTARQTQFAERSYFVPCRHCRKCCSHELRRVEACRKSWKPQ